MAAIFISYRRDDSFAYVGSVCDRLVAHFAPSHQVFMDVDGIEPGEDFVERIEELVGSCKAMIVIVGKSWAPPSDDAGSSRLDTLRIFSARNCHSAQ